MGDSIGAKLYNIALLVATFGSVEARLRFEILPPAVRREWSRVLDSKIENVKAESSLRTPKVLPL